MPHLLYLFFVFAFGASAGSFINVVVWRLPRGKSINSPPSHCPQCLTRLAWYDNIPVLGWLALRGRCRYCALPIPFRYPGIEFLCGAMLVLYYCAFFIFDLGPCISVTGHSVAGLPSPNVHVYLSNLAEQWPIYALLMFLMASLLAASLIDLELFIIPSSIPWICAIVGMAGHAIIDREHLPGNVMVDGVGGLGHRLALVILRWQGQSTLARADPRRARASVLAHATHMELRETVG